MYQKGGRVSSSNIIVNEAKRIGKWMGLKDLKVCPELRYLFIWAQCEINEDTFDGQDSYYFEIL